MTEKKKAGFEPAVRHDEEAGTVAIGVSTDGVFVPFTTLSTAEVDGLVASAKDAASRAEEPAAGE